MGRNIVICCDGTSNEFGPNVTNIVRLVQVLQYDENQQIVHYVPGVGTMPGPGIATRLGQRASIISGLAFGTGLTEIVEETYRYLSNVWQPGDQVFLFGFSRGAYTARVLAAMLHALGLLPQGNDNLVPYAMRLFRSVRNKPTEGEGESASNYWKLLNQFRNSFARPILLPGKKPNRRFPVAFIGLWDTVSSVGWVWEPATFPYTRTNPSVSTVRHALAIDERRWFFRQNELVPGKDQDCLQRWFAGSHGDVGGGYTDSQLWRCSFEWILSEAIKSGVVVNEERLEEMRKSSPPQPWLERQHESLTWKWRLAEYVPKWKWQPATKQTALRMGLGQHRTVDINSIVDRSVLHRIREMGYRPPNLPSEFLVRVQQLQAIPDSMQLNGQ